jgi:hypothetical protein
MSDCKNKELQRLILRYLAAHPEASDTSRGICEWWVPMQRLQETEQTVASALSDLVRSGRVEAVKTLDGHLIYRVPTSTKESTVNLGDSSRDQR